MGRTRVTILAALAAFWWLLIGAGIGVAASWTTKALAERGLARGPRWVSSQIAPWPYTLPPGYQTPDDWVRATDWWRVQDLGTWRSSSEFVMIEASYGVPFRAVGELIVSRSTPAGPMILDLPGTSPRSGLLAGFPLRLRGLALLGNSLCYGAVAWWVLRGRHAVRAHRRRRAGRCPECGEAWSGAGGGTMCRRCDEWRTRPRARTWYWWRTVLNTPFWLIVGTAISLALAWGGPYAGLWVGDHFISRSRQPAETWPGRTSTTYRSGSPDFLDIADCWWGSSESYCRFPDSVRRIRAGCPFPCVSGIDAEITRYTSLGAYLPPTLSSEDYWWIKIPHVGTWSLPNRFLSAGLVLDALFWSVVSWAAWRGPAAFRRLRWRRMGKCGQCGYDLKGLAAGARCPECGALPRPAAARSPT
ncbi:MAG TPA: hypothetical protein VHC70_07955 [Phycisphaerales bacterium]|nr:hypothetical protein [Phycisphaerales bacterium]